MSWAGRNGKLIDTIFHTPNFEFLLSFTTQMGYHNLETSFFLFWRKCLKIVHVFMRKRFQEDDRGKLYFTMQTKKASFFLLSQPRSFVPVYFQRWFIELC